MFNSWRTAATVQPGGLVESVERPVGSSIPVPNPYSVFHWIRWVFDEASQEVPHDQGTHRHKGQGAAPWTRRGMARSIDRPGC